MSCNDDDEDPEVRADRELRDSSTRDRTRTAKEPKYAVPVIVEEWPCRAPRCSNTFGVTREVVDGLATFNQRLITQGEREIPTSAIVLCDSCREASKPYRVEAIGKRRDQMADAIRALKHSPNPRAEHELIRTISGLHHPDVAGLLDALDRKLTSGTSRRKGMA